MHCWLIEARLDYCAGDAEGQRVLPVPIAPRRGVHASPGALARQWSVHRLMREPLGASLVGERASWGMATRAVFLALDTEQHVPALLLAKCLPRVETLRQKMTAFWRHSGFGPRFTAFSLLRRCLLLASAALLSCRCRLVSVFGPGPDISGKREWDAPGYLG
jgi:hypothetical protein